MTWNRDPERWQRSISTSTRPRHAASALLLALVLASGLAANSPAVSAATCELPAAARGSLPRSAATPAASDTGAIIQVEGADAATPASLPLAAATPVASDVDPLETLSTELTAVSEALAACLSAGESDTVIELASERYLGQLFGSSVPLSTDDYLAITSELTPTPTRLITLEQVEQTDEGRATALVTQIVGNQLMQAEWTFEQVEGERPSDRSAWKVMSERQLPVSAPGGAATLDVEIRDLTFRLDSSTVEGPDIVLRGENGSNEDHEMLVLRFADGFTTADLLRATGPDLPTSVTFVGELPVRAGGEGDLVLMDLDPGVYTLVCLFPDPQGTPHLAQGMEATFTVE
jgi:hypothetical protein